MDTNFKITAEETGVRLDSFIAQALPDISRSAAQKLVDNGLVTLNGKTVKKNHKTTAGEVFEIELPEPEETDLVPQDIPLDIVYEDEDILVVNKPPFMPIHPTVNHETNTLANAVVYYYQKQGQEHIFRCMNRLDTNTSGLTIMAKHKYSGATLGDAMRNREIHREYCAIVWGEDLPDEGCINMPIGKKEGSVIERMVREDGLEAITHYEVLERKNGLAFVRLKLETGRTHQIRVHMKDLGHPIVGDRKYGAKTSPIHRLALHAQTLRFVHPITRKEMNFTTPIPTSFDSMVK